MKKFLGIILVILIIIVIIMQFIKPNINNPSEESTKFITSHLQVTDDVLNQLKKSCFDCHSYRTEWPWYSRISPVVYLINSDVENGREQLNFSEWGNYGKMSMIDKLEGVETAVKEGEMPLSLYLPLHPDAKLSDENKVILEEWAKISKENLLNK